MSLILGGRRVEVPGVETLCWLDDPIAVPQARWGTRRRPGFWIRAIVLHTVHGRSGRCVEGSAVSDRDLRYARYQASTPRAVSWDYTVDTDGSVAVSNDPVERYTWHAGQVNPYTVGIELVQEKDGTLYTAQLDALVRLVDVLAGELEIPRQTPVRDGKPYAGIIQRLLPARGGGSSVAGVYGHRNATSNRGHGDPGDAVFHALLAAGYEGFDMEAGEDLAVWRERQRVLKVEADGVPGPATQRAMRRAATANGA